RFRMRLVEQDACLPARLFLELLGRALGGDERRTQQRLELAIAHEILLDAFDLVGEVRAFAPDLLEAFDDVLEQLVDDAALVAEELAPELDVSDLNRCECHLGNLPFRRTDSGLRESPCSKR